MEEAVRRVEMVRAFGNGTFERRTDEVLEEKAFVLELDGRQEASVILTPGFKKEWAIGHLACRGLIRSIGGLAGVSMEEGQIRVTRIPTAQTPLPRDGTVFLPLEWDMPLKTVLEAVDSLSEGPLFRRTGSAHVALLASVCGKSRFLAEDAGRHNAIDKAVGMALLGGQDLSNCFLALSGRLPSDMVEKAARAGIPLVASVSAATAGGVDAALRWKITLIGFARGGRANVYTFPERVSGVASS